MANKKPTVQMKILLLGTLATALVFIPTSLLLAFTMLPFAVALIIDRTPQRSKAFCVGVMNAAGSLPFVLELWKHGQDIGNMFEILRQPKTIAIAYAIAATGYVIEFVVSDLVSRVMVQKANFRLRDIRKQQENLKERWGDYVDGKTPLDDYGFPYER